MDARSIAGIALLVLVLGCLIVFGKGQTHPTQIPHQVSVSGFTYDRVTSPAAQALGLGGREDVPENYGMLFVFTTDGSYGFWMKDMLVPIDIIWLSDTGAILKVDADVATSTYPTVFYPPQPVRYVLETRAGEAARQGWEAGTQLSIPFTN